MQNPQNGKENEERGEKMRGEETGGEGKGEGSKEGNNRRKEGELSVNLLHSVQSTYGYEMQEIMKVLRNS